MGGKGGTAPPPAAVPQSSGMDMGAMMGLMQMMMQSNQQPMMPMSVPPPEVATAEPVDWSAQMEELGNKAKAEEAAIERKGRMDTIHSSLTDEDEDTEMNTSLLGTE